MRRSAPLGGYPRRPQDVAMRIYPGEAFAAELDPTSALDDYEIRHLAEHLEYLGDLRGLDNILRLEWRESYAVPAPAPGFFRRLLGRTKPGSERVRSHPAWFDAKNRLNSAADFVRDVQRTWRLAAKAVAADLRTQETAAGLGLEARYALNLASVNSYGAAV